MFFMFFNGFFRVFPPKITVKTFFLLLSFFFQNSVPLRMPRSSVKSARNMSGPPVARSLAGRLAEQRRAKTQSRYSKKRQDSIIIRPRAGIPLPERLSTRLIFNTTAVSAGGASGSLYYVQAVLNGPYQPVSGSHQPMGWDQLMAVYQFCRTKRAKVTVSAFPGTATGNPPMYGCSITENSSFSPSNISQIIERGNCVYDWCPNVAGFSEKKQLTKTWVADKWYPKDTSQDQSNWCTASANPTGELAYANIWAIHGGGSTYSDIYLMITVEYDVEFFGQVQLNQS